MFKLALVFAGLAVIAVHGQRQTQSTTPVPILRQINSHNDDGSYTYGFEAADGSYKIETKAANGEVKGKYGYYDDVGMLREIEYGASRNGFSPSGTGIQVPPPVISGNQITSSNPEDYDDGQYRPGPEERGDYQEPAAPTRFSNSRNFNFAPAAPVRQQPRQQQQQQYYKPQQQQQQQYYEPQPQQQQAYTPINLPKNTFNGHPASNIDLNQGSYSINYSG